MNTRAECSLVTVILIINILMSSQIGGTVSLSPSGKVCICPEEQLLFTCQVSGHNYNKLPQINWLIQFEEPDLSDVQQSYVSEDPLGDVTTDDRNGYTFAFNLMYYNTSVLISTLEVTIVLTNVSTFRQATIYCNEETNEEAARILHICTGFPSSPMNLIYLRSTTIQQRDDGVAAVMLLWNSTDDLLNNYTIFLYPPNLESASTFITSKTSFELSLAYNQEYNVSVVASNCVGNSTPTEIMILVIPVVHDQMNFSDTPINELPTTGPDSKTGYFIALGIMVPGIITAVLISVGVLLRKALKKHQESDYVPNHYSDLPLSREVNNTQHIEQRESILQTEAVNQQITYATISQQHSQANKNGAPNFCCDLSLALDDRVEYVQVKLQSESNNHTSRDESIDINLDNLLIQLRSYVTPMWKEFGLALGVAEEVLDRYSSYPPEECLVEVLDYWLRKYHAAENKLTWRDVAKAVKEIGLDQLAESILNVYQTGQLPIQVDTTENLVQSHIEQPPPLPPKMAK